MAQKEQQYTYVTRVREEGEPTYTFAEIKYGKIVAIHKHWVPLADFRKFFEADAFFIDITNVLVNGEEPVVGDVVTFGEHGYEIAHYKSTYNLTETKEHVTAQLKIERNRQESLPIEYNGNTFDCDTNSLFRLNRARLQMEDENLTSKEWTTAENKSVTLTLDDFKNINKALSERSTQLHNKYNELKSYISNIEEDSDIPILLEMNWNWDANISLATYRTKYCSQGSSASAEIKKEDTSKE